jgi:hypothetical protein
MGVLALRIGRGPANKSCSWQWVYKAKFYFWGFTSPLGPKGSPTPKGVFALPSSAVLKPAQAGLVVNDSELSSLFSILWLLPSLIVKN